MAQSHKLSLFSAILININIMIGAGLFLNTIELSKRAGILSFLSYGCVGALLLPLVMGIAYLMKIHPVGGFYTFGQKEISSWAGFMSAWSYFIGKLGSATLLVHVAASLLQTLIPPLAIIPIIPLDIAIICLFAFLNSYNLRTGKTIQTWLTIMKIVPILAIIALSAWYFDSTQLSMISLSSISLGSFTTTIPLVLYAFLGFEAAVSLSGNIENSRINGPRAIIISYLSVIGIYMAYQLLVYLAAGTELIAQESYLSVFITLLTNIFGSCSSYCTYLAHAFNCAIAISALGGSYGILFSNSWNLYTLAEHNHTFFASIVRQKNSDLVPVLCVVIEALICISYIIVGQGNVIPLQLTSAFGSVVAYSISIIALYYARMRNACNYNKAFIYFALLNCTMLTAACIRNIIIGGVQYMAPFLALFAFGMIMFIITSKKAALSPEELHT